MTRSEWLACSEPQAMLGSFSTGPGRTGVARAERKLRLALCACCRRVGGSLGPEGRAAVAAAEAHADGRLSAEALRAASARAAVEAGAAGRYSAGNQACWAAVWVAQERLYHPDQVLRSAATAAGFAAVPYERLLEEINAADGGGPQPLNARWRAAYDAERAAQAALLREVLGDPSRRDAPDAAPGARPSLPPAWRAWEGGTVPRLAAHAYAERDFTALPVLADALEDAGCADPELLRHLRGPGPHVRGCWAVDLVLGKA
jgi:hypothetical protein